MSDIQANELELSSGVKLKVDAVDTTVYLEVLSRLQDQAPKPPQTYVKAIHQWQPNYDHPDYQREMQNFQMVFTNRMIDLFLSEGVKDIKVPKNIADWNSDEFKGRMSLLHFDVPENEYERRLTWLKIVALRKQEDLQKVTQEIARLTGVSEADVKQAEAAFPGETGK